MKFLRFWHRLTVKLTLCELQSQKKSGITTMYVLHSESVFSTVHREINGRLVMSVGDSDSDSEHSHIATCVPCARACFILDRLPIIRHHWLFDFLFPCLIPFELLQPVLVLAPPLPSNQDPLQRLNGPRPTSGMHIMFCRAWSPAHLYGWPHVYSDLESGSTHALRSNAAIENRRCVFELSRRWCFITLIYFSFLL